MFTYLSCVIVLNVYCLLCASALPPLNDPMGNGRLADPKHTFQQFQINVIGDQKQPPQLAPSPGLVWVQLPESYFSTSPSPPPAAPGIYQPTSTSSSPPSTVPNSELDKKCVHPRGQFPGTSCNTYVNCWDGVAIEQACPEGLVFNPKGSYCDYPANVDCQGRPIQGSSPSPPASPTPAGAQGASTTVSPTVIATLPPTPVVSVDPNLRKKCIKPRGQFPSDACNKYVNCWDEVVVEQECPEGLLFSVKGFCDYPQNVVCHDRTPPPRSAPGQQSAPPAKKCLADFGTFRDDLNCSSYYTCIGGQVVAEYSCPPGFNFNDNIGVCDYEERVDCSNSPLVFNPKTNFLNNIPKDFIERIEKCAPGSVIRLNPQCTAACRCRDNLSEIIHCPAGLAYDSKSDKCLLPNLAQC